jgi:hypothetical protein
MKTIFTVLIFLLLIYNVASSQNASTFFPDNPGYKWYYKNIPLDTNNKPVNSLSRYRIDSFAVVTDYHGYQASTVRIKDNLIAQNQNTPYNDTNHYNFQTTNGWEYVSISLIPDTSVIPIDLFNFFKALQGWYSVFRFVQSINQEYVIMQKDTTINIDTISAPIRVKMKGKRLNDEVVSTVNGNYTSKKFIITYGLYLRVLIFEYPIVERADTIWIAPSVWMVKQVSPSVNIDLSQVGIPINIPVPGNMYVLTLPEVGIRNISTNVPAKYSLQQNYPNPFNPLTKIKFDVAKNTYIELKIYDVLGKEVSTLINEKLNAGSYSFNWDATNFPSGMYFYVLKTSDGFSETRKMLLVR